MKRFLVGIDGSPEAAVAVKTAAGLAKALAAKLLLVFVAPRHMPRVTGSFEAEEGAGDLVEHDYVPALLFQAELECRHAGVEADTTCLAGPVAETLADLAETGDFDLVVVGHRGRGAVRRALLGSVADRLVQICARPVLVTR